VARWLIGFAGSQPMAAALLGVQPTCKPADRVRHRLPCFARGGYLVRRGSAAAAAFSTCSRQSRSARSASPATAAAQIA
jgi:hypothetical protein